MIPTSVTVPNQASLMTFSHTRMARQDGNGFAALREPPRLRVGGFLAIVFMIGCGHWKIKYFPTLPAHLDGLQSV